ncbi:hypothetical protein CBS147323_11137 [Aspergillus niger]|nr:hypothetical protein CBS147323_11137 [Aspergillus niger]
MITALTQMLWIWPLNTSNLMSYKSSDEPGERNDDTFFFAIDVQVCMASNPQSLDHTVASSHKRTANEANRSIRKVLFVISSETRWPVLSKKVIESLRDDELLRREFGIQGRVTFHDRAKPSETPLENSLEQLNLEDARTPQRPANTRLGRGRGRGRGATRRQTRDGTARRRNRHADQFCVHLVADERQLPVYAVEFKAPHKVTIPELVAGLHPIDLNRDVIDQEGDTFKFHAARLVAAVVTQIFSYMIDTTLLSCGYTVIMKATTVEKQHRLQTEVDNYHRLRNLQGQYIPVCLGDFKPRVAYWYHGRLMAQMMILSWSGTRLQHAVHDGNSRFFHQERDRALAALRSRGVIHCDSEWRNMLWDDLSRRLVVIDLEDVKWLKRARALESVSANMRRSRCGRAMKYKPGLERVDIPQHGSTLSL